MKTEEMKKPTPADFKRPEVIALAVEFLAAKAKADVLHEAVVKIGAEMLANHPLTDEEGKRIEKVRFAWMAYESQGWHDWNAACVDAQLERGVRPADLPRDYCPALMADKEARKVKHRLIDESGKPFGVSVDKILAGPDAVRTLDKWTELVLKLALSKGGVR